MVYVYIVKNLIFSVLLPGWPSGLRRQTQVLVGVRPRGFEPHFRQTFFFLLLRPYFMSCAAVSCARAGTADSFRLPSKASFLQLPIVVEI